MRLTIVDTDFDGQGFPLVVDVCEVATVTPETFAQIAEFAAGRYSGPGFSWLVSQAGACPAHAQHNDWGQLDQPEWCAGKGVQ